MRERAFSQLQSAIISGEIRPGERIVEDALAAKFNVSRTPLREAIHKLEQDGLLERGANRGMIVAKLSLAEARELYDVRACLEGLAAWHAAKNLSDEARLELQERFESSYALDSETGKLKIVDRCAWVHEYILENCNHSICVEHLKKLYLHLARYQYLTRWMRGTRQVTHREHSIVIQSLILGDSFGAEAAMRNHNRISGKLAENALSQMIKQP